MSRRGSRTSRRCTRSIPTARARWPRHRPNAGRRASRSARSTACRSPSRTISPPRAAGAAGRGEHARWCPAERDAPPAARLREAGAVIFSKTTMPDYGMLSSGLSSFHPLTRNPWDLSKNPGGSSAGAGAAARAGYGPLHLGTDIGGSVRLPGVLVRPGRAEAKPRPRAGRSALCRPRRRTDDAHRRRCRADDERAVAARPPRRHEPAAQRHQLEGAGQIAAQAAHRADARCSASASRWRKRSATSR